MRRLRDLVELRQVVGEQGRARRRARRQGLDRFGRLAGTGRRVHRAGDQPLGAWP